MKRPRNARYVLVELSPPLRPRTTFALWRAQAAFGEAGRGWKAMSEPLPYSEAQQALREATACPCLA